MSLVDLADAQTALLDLLDRLPEDAWSAPTPCDDWDVAGVVRHLAVGERAFTTSLTGVAYVLADVAAELADVPVDELRATYDEGAVRLRDALGSAGPETFPTGIGPMTAPQIAELRTLEVVAHGWDIAKGTGLTLEVDEALAERTIGYAHGLIERLPADRTPFGPPQVVADDAPALDRFVALLGRQP